MRAQKNIEIKLKYINTIKICKYESPTYNLSRIIQCYLRSMAITSYITSLFARAPKIRNSKCYLLRLATKDITQNLQERIRCTVQN